MERGADPVGNVPGVEEFIVEQRQVCEDGIASLICLDREVVSLVEPVVEPIARLGEQRRTAQSAARRSSS